MLLHQFYVEAKRLQLSNQYVKRFRDARLNGRLSLERSEDGQEWTIDKSNWSLFDWRPFPEAETWREFYARVAATMEHVAQEHNEDDLPVLVVHGGTLSNIVVWWLGLPLDALPERTCFAASPGSVSMLKRNQYGNPVIERLNDRAHLATLCQKEAEGDADRPRV